MTEFDEILEDLGEFGPFQIQLLLLVSLFEIVPTMCLFMPTFSEALPEWECLSNFTSANSSLFLNETTFTTSSTSTLPIEPISYKENTSSIKNYFLQPVCEVDGTFCDGAVFLKPSASIRTEWHFCESSFLVSPITMFPVAGMVMGGLVFGQLGDTFGRKPIMFLTYTMLLISQGLMSFVHVWHLYMICRFFVGFFVIGVLLQRLVLPVEVVGNNWRILCTLPIFGVFGTMLLTLLAYLLENWRLLSITCASLGVPVLFTQRLISESPRWLLQQGRKKEFEKIVKKICDYNKKEMPEFQKLQTASTQQKCISKYSYFDLFRGRPMVRNIILLMFIWFVISIVYYATLTQMETFSSNIYLNFFILQMSEIPVFIAVFFCSDRAGRTKVISALMMTGGLACLVILLAQTLGILANMEWQVKCCALFSKAVIVGASVVVKVMCSELLPTLVRCIGIGSCMTSYELGKLMVPVILSLDKQSEPLPYIVLSCLSLITAVISLGLPETNNQNMPDELPPREWCRSCKSDNMEGDDSHYRHRSDWTDSRCVDQCECTPCITLPFMETNSHTKSTYTICS